MGDGVPPAGTAKAHGGAVSRRAGEPGFGRPSNFFEKDKVRGQVGPWFCLSFSQFTRQLNFSKFKTGTDSASP
jgi:hypothetical protein